MEELCKYGNETKKKIGAFWRGRIFSADTRAKLRAAHLGKRLPDEHRAKLAAAKLGKRMPPRTQEHRQRMTDGLRRAHARRRASLG